ncbi:RNA-guided endonuclease TnpB family protein [candidate division NPL-UPA2 bacterium]|nr:RNA-guided endonuclease TnpB family protein [candidate division NPL-UPA2 bacterium]
MPKETRSVFLYGYPTQVKKALIQDTQTQYVSLINTFIEIMVSDEKYYLALFTNNKQAPVVRQLEKDMRGDLGAAYGQNAIDKAVTELHNHFIRIKNKLYGYVANQLVDMLPYAQSVALLNALLTKQDELVILQELLQKELDKKNPNKKTVKFYKELETYLSNLTFDQREDYRETVSVMFYEKLNFWKLPFVNNAPLQLDTRLATLENPIEVDADFVLSVKLLGSKDRVELPVTTSKNSLRRMNQYRTCSMTLTMKNNKVCVGIPFEKKVKSNKVEEIIGVDAGITDLLYSSKGKAYGTFSGMDKIYEQLVEPKLKQRSKLLAVKRKYQRELKKCKDKTRKALLREKIHNISKKLSGKKNLAKKKRAYQHKVTLRLTEAIKPFVEEVKSQSFLVAMESLDITEFDRGKKANKRDSSWVRGKLLIKLQQKLSWAGIPFIEVDPAYTSKECPVCHNVNDNNRNGKSFECTVCSHKDDADHNASVNIASRAYDKEIAEITAKYFYSTKKRCQAIKALLLKRHRSCMKVQPYEPLTLRGENLRDTA